MCVFIPIMRSECAIYMAFTKVVSVRSYVFRARAERYGENNRFAIIFYHYCDCDLMCDFYNLLSFLRCVLFTNKEINHSLV